MCRLSKLLISNHTIRNKFANIFPLRGVRWKLRGREKRSLVVDNHVLHNRILAVDCDALGERYMEWRVGTAAKGGFRLRLRRRGSYWYVWPVAKSWWHGGRGAMSARLQ